MPSVIFDWAVQSKIVRVPKTLHKASHPNRLFCMHWPGQVATTAETELTAKASFRDEAYLLFQIQVIHSTNSQLFMKLCF